MQKLKFQKKLSCTFLFFFISKLHEQETTAKCQKSIISEGGEKGNASRFRYPVYTQLSGVGCVQVTISDGGVPSLSSTTRVVVTVQDVNDQRPRFLDQYQYRVRVPRLPRSDLARLGVYRVVAADDDVGLNAELEYSIVGGNGRGKRGAANGHQPFTIDSRTGMIYAQQQLDSDGHYDLQV